MTNKEKEQVQRSHHDEVIDSGPIDFDEISIPGLEDGALLRLKSFNVLLAVLDHPCKDLFSDVRHGNLIVSASILDHALYYLQLLHRLLIDHEGLVV